MDKKYGKGAFLDLMASGIKKGDEENMEPEEYEVHKSIKDYEDTKKQLSPKGQEVRKNLFNLDSQKRKLEKAQKAHDEHANYYNNKK